MEESETLKNIQHVIEVKYGKYGVPYIEPIQNACLIVENKEKTYTIRGNAEGLMLLAKALVALARHSLNSATDGYHIHLDDLYELNDENIEIILYRDEQLK